MKRSVFLIIGILALATVKANDFNKLTNIGYNESVRFVEKGIEFYVFLNGEFDFNTRYRYEKHQSHGGIYIERDYNGKVRRIGNSFINYDRYGKVKRIGNIYMEYRYGYLVRVGNLRIEYDRSGYPHFLGNVKYNHYEYEDPYYYTNSDIEIKLNIGHIFDYNDDYFHKRNFKNRYRKYREDSRYYYYRALPNAHVKKKYRVIKRRKLNNPKVKIYRKNTARTQPSRRGSVTIRN